MNYVIYDACYSLKLLTLQKVYTASLTKKLFMCKCSSHKITCTVKHVLSGHHWEKEKVAL